MGGRIQLNSFMYKATDFSKHNDITHSAILCKIVLAHYQIESFETVNSTQCATVVVLVYYCGMLDIPMVKIRINQFNVKSKYRCFES